MKCYRMTSNSYQASEDRRLMHNAGLEVLGTVQFTDKAGDARYLTFAQGSISKDVCLPVTIVEIELS